MTDGYCEVRKQFKEKFHKTKAKKGLKVYSINLSGEDGIFALETLKGFSDEIINISDLTKDGIKSMNNLLSNI